MKVLITQPIDKNSVDLLKSRYAVDFFDRHLSKAEIINSIKDATALICSVNDQIDEEVIAAAESLKIIANVAVGYNNIDTAAARARNIAVTNTPNTLEQSVVEFVFSHLLTFARRVIESDNYVRQGHFDKWSLNLLLGNELAGKTLGIVGFGNIGKKLVAPATAFGMDIIYTNQSGELAEFKNNPKVNYGGLEAVLAQADYVVLLVPLTEATKYLITLEKLRLMKPSAVLINMARGSVVREMDLIQALEEKVIAGACLDVYEFEPKVPEELLKLPNTLLTPHVGSATVEARQRMAWRAAQNVIDILTTGECQYIVN